MPERGWALPGLGRGFCVALLAVSGWTAAVAGADAPELHFTILHTNDEHSALLPVPYADYHPEEPDPTVGGFARLGGLLNTMRAAKAEAGEPVLVFSAADILGGTPYTWLIPLGEAPEITLMQQMGYDAVTIGNHEFDYGADLLAAYYRAAGYPEANAVTALVASNLVIPEGHPLGACGLLETHVFDLDNGLRVGVFGLLGANAARLAAKMPPVAVSDLVAASASAVETLRARGADVVVALSHSGIDEDSVVASAVPGIDVIISGHYHPLQEEPLYVGDTIVAKAGAFAHYLGVLELAYTPADGTLRIRNEETGQPYVVRVDDSIAPDPAITKSLAAYTEKLDGLVERLTGGRVRRVCDPVADAGFVLRAGPAGRESVLGNLVTDAIRFVAEEKTGQPVDFAIQANGVIRGSVRPGTMPHALNRVTFYDLATAISLGMGYDDTPGYPLVSIYLTGNEIYRMLELSRLLAHYADVFYLQLSGARFTYDPDRLILFEVPRTRFPVPTLRAVLGLERYTGPGVQGDTDDHYVPVPRGDDTLYHVVCDYYILSFFPRIASLLPVYRVIPKDREGKPLQNPRDAVIEVDGRELKFWQAVVEYVDSLPHDAEGLPQIPESYAETGGRIIRESGPSLLTWGVLALPLLFL